MLAQVVAKRANLRSRAQNPLEVERVGKMIVVRFFLLRGRSCALHQPSPRGRRFGLLLATLLVVLFDQMIPALWADAADSAKEIFDSVTVGPERCEALPFVDVHAGQHVRNSHLSGRTAARNHRGQLCCAREPDGQAALRARRPSGVAWLRRCVLPVFTRGKAHVCWMLRTVRLANHEGRSGGRWEGMRPN